MIIALVICLSSLDRNAIILALTLDNNEHDLRKIRQFADKLADYSMQQTVHLSRKFHVWKENY